MKHDTKESELVLPGHFIGLKFRGGWWFVHVMATEEMDLKPWVLLNENGERGAIAAQTAGSEDDEIKDAVNRHMLIPSESERDLIFQYQFGVAPSRMQIYPIFGRDRVPNIRGTAEPGSNQVWVTGFDSPYNDPSDQAEMFNINGIDFPSLQAYNPMDEPAEARLSFHVNKIKYATVTDVGLMKAMIQGQQPSKLYQMGIGARSTEQLRAPSWLQSNFGQHMYSTEEILSSGTETQTTTREGGTAGQ